VTITPEAIQSVSNEIARLFSPEKVLLFGSYAYGNPHSGSDVDLLVILPFEERPFLKSLEILRAIERPFGIDLLARTPEDTEKRYKEGDPLIREALDNGHILYERHHSRMAS
jgi:uncharacterized protein